MALQISIARNRIKLADQREPYWQAVTRGRHIGVRKSKGSEYWVTRAMVDGKYLHRALRNVKDWDSAMRAAKEFFDFLDRGGKSTQGTVSELFNIYVESVKPSPTHSTIKKTLQLELGDVKLTDLRASHVKRWRQSNGLLKTRQNENRSAATINRMVNVLRAALNYGVKEQLLIDTSWRVQLERIKEDGNFRELYLSPDDRRNLINCAAEDAKPFIRLLSILPLRPGDWNSAIVSHFDKKSDTLFVSSKDHPRHVPLSNAARELLKNQAKEKLPNALLFVRANGKAWDKQTWNVAIKDAAKKAGLPPDTNAYALRHSTITDLCVQGLDIHSTAKLSGTSIAMIEKHYGKLLKNVATDALNRIAI